MDKSKLVELIFCAMEVVEIGCITGVSLKLYRDNLKKDAALNEAMNALKLADVLVDAQKNIIENQDKKIEELSKMK